MTRRSHVYIPVRALALGLVEAIMATLALVLAMVLYLGPINATLALGYEQADVRVALVVFLFVFLCMYYCDLYDLKCAGCAIRATWSATSFSASARSSWRGAASTACSPWCCGDWLAWAAPAWPPSARLSGASERFAFTSGYPGYFGKRTTCVHVSGIRRSVSQSSDSMPTGGRGGAIERIQDVVGPAPEHVMISNVVRPANGDRYSNIINFK